NIALIISKKKINLLLNNNFFFMILSFLKFSVFYLKKKNEI
ncbi:MAG: hypothetical protein ACI9TK_000879, partial [Flavobacteriaceae bacterium]